MAKYINPYNLTAEQRTIYELSLIQYRDMKSAIDTAVEEAVEIAIEENQMKIANKAILKGWSDEDISQITDLPLEIVIKLRNELKKQYQI